MRVLVEIETVGSATMDDLLASITSAWQKFIGDDSAKLPQDSEVHVTQELLTEERTYGATFQARMKIDVDQIK